ncbi:MAG: phage virion morphogenesis protein [Deltaproteobacteria bacterium]|nr:phage virion morphogenesis protein [Deltaproteobacteria bacterium]
MRDGASEMDAMVAQLRALPGMVERAAPDIARALDDELRANIARGVGPDGTPWKPTKDGTAPLANAGKALSTRAVGTVVLARLDGVEARHHLGAIRGSSKENWLARPILPSNKIPAPVAKAIKTILTEEFEETTGGAP